MSWLRFLRRGRRDDELARELESYLAHEVEDRVASGETAESARDAAARKLGNTTRIRETAYERNSFVRLEGLARDLRHAARLLARSPGFTLAAVLSLALGIGANAAIFQLVDAVRLRSLPVVRPDELVQVTLAGGNHGIGISQSPLADFTNPQWEALERRQAAFSSLFAWGTTEFYREKAHGLVVSGGFFPVLGVVPYRGRLLGPADDVRGCGAGPAVISHAYWMRRFGGDETVLGKPLVLGGQTFHLVGITPPEFFGLEVGSGFDIALPLCSARLWGQSLDQRNLWWLDVMGRLEPHWTVARASAYMTSMSAGLIEATLPSDYDPAVLEQWRRLRFEAVPAGRGVSTWRESYETSLWLLLGITGLVLLVACANVANLMLARASVRQREFAVRLALGGSRSRLASQMLAESGLVALAGAVAAVALADVLAHTLVSFVSTDNNVLRLDLRLDWRFLLFTSAVALVTCVLCGVAPALRSARSQPADVMKTGGRGVLGGTRGLWFQRALVTIQIAVSLVLIAGALLFVRSFQNLLTLDVGFRQEGLLLGVVDLSTPTRPPADLEAAKTRLVERIRAIPAVQAATTSTHLPLTGMSWTLGIRAPGVPASASKFIWVGPGYFQTMQIPLVAGRSIGSEDAAQSQRVLVVNETFVARCLGGRPAIGATVESVAEPDYPRTFYQIVGVVADTKYAALRDETPPIAYAPELQHPAPQPWTFLAVRTGAALNVVTPAVERALRATGIPTDLVLWRLRDQVRDGLVRERLMSWLSGFFGVLAVLLAALGLYGVMSYAVARRSTEIAIRTALGARRADVLWLVLGQACRLLAIGLPAGALAALAVGRTADALLFGLQPDDPATLALAAVLLGAVGLAAAYVPAARAARVSPVDGLRQD